MPAPKLPLVTPGASRLPGAKVPASSFFREFRRVVMIVVSVAYFMRVGFKLLPSSLSPVLWTSPNALRPLEGVLAVNERLRNARKVSGEWAGPESLGMLSLPLL